MRLLVLFIFCLMALVSCDSSPSPNRSGGPSSSPSPGTTPASYDFSSLDRTLEQICRKHGGCALVLVKGDQVIYRKAVGGFGTDKVVPIASASKWLSGALIMNLVDEGKLSLDDPVSKYLPQFTGDKANITVRQLFSHTSGLPPEAGCRNNKRTTLEDCAKQIAGVQLRAKPGEEFYYGGVSTHVGGRIAEIVTGRSFNELFVERIAAPLGMSQTDFFAYGPTKNPRPAGDGRGTADDYARFLQMIINGGVFQDKRILSVASTTEMHRDQTGGVRIGYTIYERHGTLDPSLLQARYGIGVWREKVDESNQLLEAASPGALGFSPWIDFQRNLAGVLSVQSSFSRVLPDYLELKKRIRQIVK